MRGSAEQLGDVELAGVTQANAISSEQADGEVVPHCYGQPMHHRKAGHGLAVLDLTHKALAHSSPLRNLFLRESSHRASRDHLFRKSRRNLTDPRAESDSRCRHMADGDRRPAPLGYC